jgi:hypothetical protein
VIVTGALLPLLRNLGEIDEGDPHAGTFFDSSGDTALISETVRAGDVVSYDADGWARPFNAADGMIGGVIPIPDTGGRTQTSGRPSSRRCWERGTTAPVMTVGRVVARLAAGARGTIRPRGPVYVLPGGAVTGDASAPGARRIPRSEAIALTQAGGGAWDPADGVLVALNGMF